MTPHDSLSVFEMKPFEEGSFPAPDLQTWRAAAEKSLKGRSLESLTKNLSDDVSVKPLYTAADAFPDPGLPGSPPFVRGRLPVDGDRPPWQVSQLFGDPDLETTCRQIAQEDPRGGEAVWLRLAAGARLGLEPGTSDFEASDLDGVLALHSNDFERVLAIRSTIKAPIHIDAGGNAVAASATLVAAAFRRNEDVSSLCGSFNIDPLAAWASDGQLTYGFDRSLGLMAPAASWCLANAPKIRAVSVSTIPYHLAAATPVHELAFALATGVEYLRALEKGGLSPADGCRQLRFIFAIGRDFFAESAKLRAFRRLWGEVALSCGVEESDAPPHVHAVTSPRSLTTRDPWVNALRTTTQAFAAVTGGADALTVLPFDHQIGPSDALARRMALNTHTILRDESHVGRVTDPAGGSWFVEKLTTDLADAAWKLFQDIEVRGGFKSLLGGNELSTLLTPAITKSRKDIARRKTPVTGVSTWPNIGEEPVTRPATDRGSVVAAARNRLASNSQRSGAEAALTAVAEQAALPNPTTAVFDAAVRAARSGATVAELAAALRAGSSPSRSVPLPRERFSAPYEALRDRSDQLLGEEGSRPSVFLVTIGSIPEHKARVTFAKNVFEAGGFEAIETGPLETVDDAVKAYDASGATRACLCSSDNRYAESAEAIAMALRDAGAQRVLLAGKPLDHEKAWREAGIDSFIYLGCDVLGLLTGLIADEGSAS